MSFCCYLPTDKKIKLLLSEAFDIINTGIVESQEIDTGIYTR